MSKQQRSQTFMFGAIILMLSAVFVKVIGALLRVPLTNIMGVEGMAYYNAAYSIYVPFYTISTAGIPVAVSRMIATASSQNKHREIKKIFRVALIVFLVIGFIGTAAMMLGSKAFARNASMPDAYIAMIAIAPTIFFICLSSAYRGYFQGLKNMVPTAVSQVIEAVAKLGIGIVCALYFTKKGYPAHVVAAFVILGVTIGVLLGALYSMVVKAMYSHAERENTIDYRNESCRSVGKILGELIVISIPITLASSIMGFTNVIDTMRFANGLQRLGIPESAATAYYGTYTSMVYPLFNLVPPFIYSFGISAIPSISSSIAVGNREKASQDIDSAFRNCALIAIPSAIGLGCLSRNVISFLFADEIISYNGIEVSAHSLASPALTVISAGVLFLGIISITNSILQACKKEWFTIISMVSGIAMKFVSIEILSRIPDFGVLSAAISTLICYFTIMVLNVMFMVITTGFKPNPLNFLVKPLIAGVCCGGVAVGCSKLLSMTAFHSKLATLVSIGCAAIVYVVVLLAIKGVNRYDVLMMPKGKKICSIMEKLHILKKED